MIPQGMIPSVVLEPYPAWNRKDPAEPYCPRSCPYQCLGGYKAGHCLIRTQEATQVLKEAHA